MATREERMRDRMRGAGRHNVGDIDFGFIIPVAEEPADEPEQSPPAGPSPAPAPAPTTRPTPNTSAKRKRLEPQPTAEHDVYSLPEHSTEAGETTRASRSPSLPRPAETETQPEEEDHPMTDAPPLNPPTTTTHQATRSRGPLSSVISATKRLSFDPSSPPPASTTSRRRTAQQPQPQFPPEEMEVTESPADAPGSGRRRPLRVAPGTPVVGSSVLLQRVLAEEAEAENSALAEQQGNSSPVERRVARRRSEVVRGRGRRRGGRAAAAAAEGRTGRGRVSGSSVAESEVAGGEVVAVVEEEVEEEVEEVVLQVDEDRDVDGEDEDAEEEEEQKEEEQEEEEQEEEEQEEEEQEEEEQEEEEQEEEEQEEEEQEQEEQEEEVAEEVGEEEAAQRLGRKRPRRSLRAPSPELDSGVAEELPLPKRRRRREVASPAQQQQPAKKPRGRPPARTQPEPQPQPSPEPQRQPQPKTKAKPKKQAKKKSRGADEDEAEKPSGSVQITVQRFTKPPRAANAEDGEEEADADLNDIPFANRGGVNAIDVLSKLCEELIGTYMDKLEARARAAEDAATRREQKTMYRALEALQEELRTRLLEHTIALDTLHALRKRVRAAQKEKLTLRDDIMRIRAEREQVALRMDAIRIQHEADSKEALRHISLSSAMHDIDLAVEKGQAAPELTPAEQKRAELANLELLVSRVADQACSRSDGGGALKQIREFNAFLERTAAVLEGR